MLVGLSGSGKTTTGIELELKHGLKTFDVDLEIERETKKSVAQIIRVEGEEEFRRREVEMLQRAFSLPIDCISTGAGALNKEQNRESIRKHGFMVWLCGSTTVLESRLHQDDNTHAKRRPLLEQGTREQRIQMLQEMAKCRDPYYSQAELKVWTDYVKPAAIAEVVMQEWVNCGSPSNCFPIKKQKNMAEQEKNICSFQTSIPHDFSQDQKHTQGEIVIGQGVACKLVSRIAKCWPKASKVLLITDETLFRLYGESFKQMFEESAFMLVPCVVPVGEKEKCLVTVEKVAQQMLDQQFTRDDVLVAFGGGVVGDVGSLVASLYARGIGLVQLPTTIVAQVDSAIGGKTAVNLTEHDTKKKNIGKNILGTFYPAKIIISDVEFLKTLPDREFVSGFAEVIKYGLIQDNNFFEWLVGQADKVQRREQKCLVEIVEFCSRTKLNIVLEDMTDIAGKRILLNFGHTFGHALEVKSGFTELLHGEAVAVGMVLAVRFGESVGVTPVGTAKKLQEVLRSFRLPIGLRELPGSDKFLPDVEQLKSEQARSSLVRSFDDATRADKKRSANVVKEVLLEMIGKPIVREVPVEELVNFLCAEVLL